MTTPPYQPGPYGQPNQDPYGQQPGGGYGQYGPRPPEQPQYGGEWAAERPTQQFGPGQTQQFGQPQYGTPQWGGGGYEPPEPPRKKTGVVVAIVTIAVLVIAGAGVGLYFVNKDKDTNSAGSSTTTQKTTEPSDEDGGETTTDETETTTGDPGEAIDAQPGDCIKVNVASETDADVETVDCATPEAVYKVATREETDTGSCPNDQYVQYTEEGQLLLCLQLNVRDGECLEVTDNEDKRADCGSPSATHRVVGVFDGVDDETRCGAEATEVLTYPQPPLTVCLVSPAS